MADWSVVFAETLECYLLQYINACGNSDQRAIVLKRCHDAIVQSPKVAKDEIQLPTPLRLAIRKEFLPYLVEEDQANEEAAIKAAEERHDEKLTPDERSDLARPTEAGDYRKPWDSFRAAQRIFKEEVDKVDEHSRDKSDRKSLGVRTKVLRQWWNDLDVKRKEEAERVAASWNARGAPPEKQAIYRKKNLRSDASEFLDSLRRTMGVHAVMLVAYKSIDGVKTTILETTPPPGRNKAFSIFSGDAKKWANDGGGYLSEYFFGKDEEQSESDSEDGDDELTPAVDVDINGNPLLPLISSRRLKAWQHVVREIFRVAYIKITTRAKVPVPWLLLSKAPTEYIDPATIPTDFRITDPSKFTKVAIDALWSHWRERERQGLPILTFIKARSEDLPAGQAPLEFRPRRKRLYVEVDSPDGQDNDHGAIDDPSLYSAGEGRTTPRAAGPASGPSLKHPRSSLDDQHLVPEETSPAANAHDHGAFLCSLSSDLSYLKLVAALSSLPHIRSSPPESRGNLPVWTSWKWEKKYLPAEVHTVKDEFCTGLSKLRRTKLADVGSGTAVVLGLGLLLRECWRAVEAEPDSEGVPDFLINSSLGHEKAEMIVSVIKEILEVLPSPRDNSPAKTVTPKRQGPSPKQGGNRLEGEVDTVALGKNIQNGALDGIVPPKPQAPHHSHDRSDGNTRSGKRVRKPSKRILGKD